MATKDVTKISLEIDEKYNIKRPEYTLVDLEELRGYFHREYKRNADWKDFWVEDETLTRFLKANITVQESLEALIVYCEWRHNYDVDNISPDDQDVQREASACREKILEDVTDYGGRQVLVLFPSLHNMYHGNYPSLYKYITFQMEQLTSICDQMDGDGTFCLVVDLKGFSMKNMDYTAVRKVFWILKSCYPERLGVCLIINYPWLFYGCWEILKMWLTEVTRSKIHFCTKKQVTDFLDLEKCGIEMVK